MPFCAIKQLDDKSEYLNFRFSCDNIDQLDLRMIIVLAKINPGSNATYLSPYYLDHNYSKYTYDSDKDIPFSEEDYHCNLFLNKKIKENAVNFITNSQHNFHQQALTDSAFYSNNAKTVYDFYKSCGSFTSSNHMLYACDSDPCNLCVTRNEDIKRNIDPNICICLFRRKQNNMLTALSYELVINQLKYFYYYLAKKKNKYIVDYLDTPVLFILN